MQRDAHPVTRIAAFHLAKDRLELVEREIAALRDSEIPLVREIATYLLDNGGKRVRPGR